MQHTFLCENEYSCRRVATWQDCGGDDVPREAKEAAVEVMLEKLGLQKCADTPVGNEDIRGISGGEKKRTSIGCELMVNPAVLFVDEPTSGLDSKMARSVVEHSRACTR